MPAPVEIVAAPLTVYVANEGSAFPAINVAPSGSWTKLGTSGDKNYNEDGVKVTHSQSIAKFTPAGGTGARKAWRTEEMVIVEFTLVDLTPEQYAKILNDASVTTVVGPPADKNFPLQQGITVKRFALLARGLSSVDATKNAQYEVPVAIQAANPEPVYKKDTPAGLVCRFESLEDSAAGFGVLRIGT